MQGAKQGERALYITPDGDGMATFSLEHKAARSRDLVARRRRYLRSHGRGSDRAPQLAVRHVPPVRSGARRKPPPAHPVRKSSACSRSASCSTRLGAVCLLASDALRYRRELLALKAYFEQQKMTVLLLDDRLERRESARSGEHRRRRHHHGKISAGLRRRARRIHITKVRSSDFWDGYHD